MSIILIGGIDGLRKHYHDEARIKGVNLKVFTKPEKDITRRIGRVDAIVIFTDKVSHSLKQEVTNYARSKGIPCFLYHSCGVTILRRCIDCIKKTKEGGKT